MARSCTFAVNSNGNAFEVDGLWGPAFGNGARNQPAGALYLPAGGNAGANGFYARIDLGALAPDISGPTNVAITAPAAAANVSGTVSVTAGATDNVRVARVVFSVLTGGNTREIGADAAPPYAVNWNQRHGGQWRRLAHRHGHRYRRQCHHFRRGCSGSG